MGQMYTPEKIYYPIGGINNDSNGITCRETECIDCVNMDVTSSQMIPRKGTTSIEPEEYLKDVDGEIIYDVDGEPIIVGYPYPEEDILHYHKYITPTSIATIYAFCASKIYRFVFGAGWEEVSNSLLTGKLASQWSVVSFVDTEIGPTMVAAGSLYVRPGDIATGGSQRILLYWDEETNYFKELTQYTIFPVTEEECMVGVGTSTILGAVGAATSDENFISVAPGLLDLYTNLQGQLASIGSAIYSLPVGKISLGDASDGAAIDCYKLIPADDGFVEYGDSSYVRVDGKEISLKLLDDTYDGSNILVNYSYRREVYHKPAHLISFQNSLVSANTFELEDTGVYHPYRVRWTEQGSIFETRENYYQDLIDAGISPILKLSTHESAYYNTVASFLYAFKDGIIYRGKYNANYKTTETEVPFLLFELAMSDGVEAVRTIVPIGNAQIYLSRSDVYLFDGITSVSLTLDRETGNTRVRDMIFDGLDLDELQKTFAVWDEANKKYMLFVKKTSDTSYPTTCYIYSMLLNQWTRYVYPEVAAAISTEFAVVTAIGDLAGSIEDLQGNINALGSRTTKTLILAMTAKSYILSSPGANDKVGFLGAVGTTPDYYLITRDFFGATLQNQDRCQLVYIEGRYGKLDISHNSWYEKDISEFQEEYTLQFQSKIARNQYNLDIVGNNIRFLLKFKEGHRFRWLQAFTVQQEESNI